MTLPPATDQTWARLHRQMEHALDRMEATGRDCDARRAQLLTTYRETGMLDQTIAEALAAACGEHAASWREAARLTRVAQRLQAREQTP